MEIAAAEADIWNSIKNENMSASVAMKKLCEARDAGTRLSARSVDLITLESDTARSAYVNEMKEILYTQSTLVTCMDTLRKDSEEGDCITYLVVGTEAGECFVVVVVVRVDDVICRTMC